MALYDMARRITELVLRRNIAIGELREGPQTRNVTTALHTLEGDTAAGEPGGPARYPTQMQNPSYEATTNRPLKLTPTPAGAKPQPGSEVERARRRRALLAAGGTAVPPRRPEAPLQPRRPQPRRPEAVRRSPRQVKLDAKHLRARGADRMTGPERDVAEMVAEGSTNAEIADTLHLNINTIKSRLKRIFLEFGFKNRAQLARHMAGRQPRVSLLKLARPAVVKVAVTAAVVITGKLAVDPLARWKREELPHLVGLVDDGYDPDQARAFKDLTDVQRTLLREAIRG